MPVLDIFTAGPLWATDGGGKLERPIKPAENRAMASNLLFIKFSYSEARLCKLTQHYCNL
jgi:hypothetical protein